jgi:ABC-type sugar transport system ATPase subunit
VNVTVRQGEILAIMGPSGSGKSTLLHCLAGIFTPDQGDVLFDGQIVNAMSEDDRTRLRRTAFGFVFQFGQLVPELTAADNVALPLLLSRRTSSTWTVTPGSCSSRRPLRDGGTTCPTVTWFTASSRTQPAMRAARDSGGPRQP